MGGVSLKPSEQTTGGLLLDDVDVSFDKCRFVKSDVLEDYNAPDPVPGLLCELTPVESGEGLKQFFSCGSTKDFVPSKDGKRLESVSGVTGIRKSCNAAMLITSIVNAGFPEDQLGDEISNLDGMVAHVIQIAAPKRAGLLSDKRKGKDGKEYDRTITSVNKIVSMPGEGKKGKKGKGKTAPTDDAVIKAAESVVLNVLIEADGPLAKHDLPGLVFKKLKGAERKTVLPLVQDDEFLSASDTWTYKDGKLVLAE